MVKCFAIDSQGREIETASIGLAYKRPVQTAEEDFVESSVVLEASTPKRGRKCTTEPIASTSSCKGRAEAKTIL
jgi:hypothetical protein